MQTNPYHVSTFLFIQMIVSLFYNSSSQTLSIILIINIITNTATRTSYFGNKEVAYDIDNEEMDKSTSESPIASPSKGKHSSFWSLFGLKIYVMIQMNIYILHLLHGVVQFAFAYYIAKVNIDMPMTKVTCICIHMIVYIYVCRFVYVIFFVSLLLSKWNEILFWLTVGLLFQHLS